MGFVNKVILIGNLGGDPEVKYLDSGQAVANFSLATNDRWKDRNDEQHERTEWHRIVAWGKLAEIAGNYLHKGKQVYVEGKLQTREWEDRDGSKRRTTEVVAFNITFLGSADGERRGSTPYMGGGTPGPTPQQQSRYPADDEIPF